MTNKRCPDCNWVLTEGEDDDGVFLYCPNEMCLNQDQLYLHKPKHRIIN